MKNRKFYYKVKDPSFENSITIDISIYKTVEDLKKQIARYHHFPDYNISIINNPNERKLKNIKYPFILELSFQNRNTNIKFSIPGCPFFFIIDCYKKTFDEIVESFRNEHLYYSNESKKYMQFLINGKEVPHIKYPLFAVPFNTTVQFRVNNPVVILKYGFNKFIFIDNEDAINAFNYIKSIYKGCTFVSIQNEISHEKINYGGILKSFKNYKVQVIYNTVFYSIDCRFKNEIKLDYLATVFDAKELLSNTIKISNIKIKPNNIIIFNEKKERIYVDSTSLKRIQDFNKIYYYDFDDFLKSSIQKSSKKGKDIDIKIDKYPISEKKHFDSKEYKRTTYNTNYFDERKYIKTNIKKEKEPFFFSIKNHEHINKDFDETRNKKSIKDSTKTSKNYYSFKLEKDPIRRQSKKDVYKNDFVNNKNDHCNEMNFNDDDDDDYNDTEINDDNVLSFPDKIDQNENDLNKQKIHIMKENESSSSLKISNKKIIFEEEEEEEEINNNDEFLIIDDHLESLPETNINAINSNIEEEEEENTFDTSKSLGNNNELIIEEEEEISD